MSSGIQAIAEVGINHGGSVATAERMIHAAKDCGCDGVKVQSFRCHDFLPEGHPDWPMFEQAEIWPWLPQLADLSHRLGLVFGVTPQSVEGVEEAVDCGADYIKIGSDQLLRHDMIREALETGLPVWVSTGMASPDEIRAVEALGPVRLMLCTSLYPCPPESVNIQRLKSPMYQGFSDHTEGTAAATLAGYLLATRDAMYERHFTLDKTADGPDHWFSANPFEMAGAVEALRLGRVMRGGGLAGFVPAEVEGREKWRTTEESPLRA